MQVSVLRYQAIKIEFDGRERSQGAMSLVDLQYCVVDCNVLGFIVGIEVINLALSTGLDQPPSKPFCLVNSGEEWQCSYDPEDDVMRIRLSGERSVDQYTAIATAQIDMSGCLATIHAQIPWPPAGSQSTPLPSK
ncbi:MAG: hypothetical protein IT365_21395 [Candidatus Hydrogenedentes bacterium]|nr:hypothetical protein [Candidatus Hydrogenedentota bacterium]